jgi:DNA polymerase-1
MSPLPLVIPDTLNALSRLDAARFYREQCGWLIHPCYGPTEGSPRERGKKPKLVTDDRAAVTWAELEKQLGATGLANAGLAPRPPHVVVDLDAKRDRGESVHTWLTRQPHLAAVPRERTANGAHLHFICRDLPEIRTTSGKLPSGGYPVALDLADGVTAELYFCPRQNVIIAPSVHPSGVTYRWEVTGPVPEVTWAQLTAWFGFRLESPTASATTTAASTSSTGTPACAAPADPTAKTPGPSDQAAAGEDDLLARESRRRRKPSEWKFAYHGDLTTLRLEPLLSARGLAGTLLNADQHQHSLRCPWSAEHGDQGKQWAPSSSETTYWHTPGRMPAFKCLHAHCAERTLEHLLAWCESQEPGSVDAHCAVQRVWKTGSTGSGGRPRVLQPNLNRADSDFADEVGKALSPRDHWYQKSSLIVEIEPESHDRVRFLPIKPNRAITSVERWADIGVLIKVKTPEGDDQFEFATKSLNNAQASVLLESQELRQHLQKIERLLTVPMPIRLPDGALGTPQRGYDPRFLSYLPETAPRSRDMSLTDARRWLHELLKEFCFRDQQSVVHAVAAMLTPYCRGLFPRWSCRTPVTIYEANRPRAGKDYLAGCLALIVDGYDTEDTPVPADFEELRKKITSAMIAGRRRMHFANCRGFLNSDVLENVTTSELWADRVLGANQQISMPNELEFSLSANIGLTYTPDFAGRARKIRLAFYEENPNGRAFSRTDLKGWVRAHRSELVSALGTFVREWNRMGQPKGPSRFTSFPAWGEIVGGIMVANGLGDPCLPDQAETAVLGGDTETRDMKILFEVCYAQNPDAWIKPDVIRSAVIGSEIFNWITLDERSGQIRFGHLLSKYVGRELSDIRLLVDTTSGRSNRYNYKFSNDNGTGKGGDVLGFLIEKRPDSTPTEPSAPTRNMAILDTLALDSILKTDLLTNPIESIENKKNKTHTLYIKEGEKVRNLPTLPPPLTDRACLEDIAVRIAEHGGAVALDLETYGTSALDPRRGDIRLLSLAVSGSTPWVLDLCAIGYDLAELGAVLSTGEVVVHNARFDCGWLREKCGLLLPKVFCTLTASRLLSAGTRAANNLGACLSRHLGINLPKDQGTSDWGAMLLTDDQLAYAANDVAHLLELADTLRGGLHEAGLTAVAALEMSLIPVVVAMEANGIAVDAGALTRLRDTHRQQAHACAAQVRELLGADARLNPGSPDQLKTAFAAAGVDIDSTAEAVLTTLDHPAAAAVLELRGCEKVAQQAEALLEAVSRDGRIHAQFDPTGTETGRFSSKQPNLQNIGRGVMRSCFVAAPGYVLVGADYSQIELRVAALLAPEPMMLAAYERGEDLHRQTAALVLQKPAEAVTKADRQMAKAVNFGLIYGQTAKGLVEYARTAYAVILTEAEARRHRARFFNAYAGLAAWHDRTRARAEADDGMESRTALGRRRVLPTGREFFWQRFAGALNSPVQGGAADGMKLALRLVAERLPTGARIVSTVHDEVIVEAPADQAAEVKTLLETAMVEAMRQNFPGMPVVVEATSSPTWEALK